MENKRYIRFSYELDKPYCDFNELGLLPINNDNVFTAIEFKDGFATLYCKEEFVLQGNHSIEEVEKDAERRLFAIFLEIIKSSNAPKFKIQIEESYFNDKQRVYIRGNTSFGISCSVNIEAHRADGSIITDEENSQMSLDNNKIKMEQIIQNSNDMMLIKEQDKQGLMKLFMVEDPVIRYFILYSWLSKLLLKNGREHQDEVNVFIINSNTYSVIPASLKHPPLRNGRDDKTYFTYLRNLMGHTVADALAVSDTTIIEKVKTYTSWLLQILLEKLI